MSYQGGRLEPWFDAAPCHEFGLRAARAGGFHTTRLVKLNTPVDTGLLRESITEMPVLVAREPSGTVYQSGAQTELDYAPHVEYPTGLYGPKHAKYPIVPKKPGGWLHWIDDAGRDVFRRKVMHPGSKGAHMFSTGVAEAEQAYDRIVAPALYVWARQVENQNHTGLATP